MKNIVTNPLVWAVGVLLLIVSGSAALSLYAAWDQAKWDAAGAEFEGEMRDAQFVELKAIQRSPAKRAVGGKPVVPTPTDAPR